MYHGINEAETFETLGIVIKRISDCVEERLGRMKLRLVASACCTAPFLGVVQLVAIYFFGLKWWIDHGYVSFIFLTGTAKSELN